MGAERQINMHIRMRFSENNLLTPGMFPQPVGTHLFSTGQGVNSSALIVPLSPSCCLIFNR